jgi:hypothetical protein
MKTRSSSGVGQKVDLEFNVDTLRISDLGEEEESSFSQQKQQSQSSMMSSFKRTSVVSTASSSSEPLDVTTAPWARTTPTEGFNIEKPKVKATTGPSIRNMLNNLNPEKD